MRFYKNTRRKAAEYEKDLLTYWRDNHIFEKSIANRPKQDAFVFYDGPPFLTGTPHHGHLLISSVKDAVARYQTMKGRRVERRWGWDCHGLPAEVFVEKKLGITSKKEIGTTISVADYVKECRAAMVKTGTEWEDTIERIGRWVEFNGAYKTMDAEYMESVWWAFKTLYEKGSIYEGEKILVYCTKDATPISKSEVAMENSYQQDTDPSVFVYFKLEGRDEHVMAWTTTPWTLPANVAVAVNPNLEYSLVEYNGFKSYVATAALDRVFTDEKHNSVDYIVVSTTMGSDLVGLKYHPLFENRGPSAHRILAADFVTADDGTGIVHEAPAYGEEDYDLCKKEGIPVLSIVDENGCYTEGQWIGQNIWDVNKEIAKWLVAEGKALKVTYIVHDYPHCHRCGSKLMYRAHPSWFMDVQGQKTKMLASNKATNWMPKHLKEGRFNNIIESAPDWNISRDRYWATPIPVWRGYRPDGTEVVKVIGSYEEFEQLTGLKLDDYHLPNVMDVEFEVDGVVLRHIGKVLDCWFESGSMPFAQFHYPFENIDTFESSFPADFIIEAIDQTRGWFYSLMAVNVGLFDKSPFKNLICTGFVNAADGKKMSKKLGNYTDPGELMDQYTVDAFRFILLSSPLLNGEDFALKDKDVLDVQRKLSMIWNMYDFFTLYADVDEWEFAGKLENLDVKCGNSLDTWVISRLHETMTEVDVNMQAYNFQDAIKPILPFIDDASNWYVRRSRRRFWKADDLNDKDQAYKTLHYVLTQLAVVLAPFTPFLAEELYKNLTGGESVHLVDWPKAGHIDKVTIRDMATVRSIINEGLAERSRAGVKVRQPLCSVDIGEREVLLSDEYVNIIKEELNVKSVMQKIRPDSDNQDLTATDKVEQNGGVKVSAEYVRLDLTMTPELAREGMARELIRAIQSARKDAGYDVEDRINIDIESTGELQTAWLEHQGAIYEEVLALDTIKTTSVDDFSTTATIDGIDALLILQKVS